MLNQLAHVLYVPGASFLVEFYLALASRDPLAVFSVLMFVLLLLGWAANEIGADKDPVRSHQKFKAQQKSHTVIRL